MSGINQGGLSNEVFYSEPCQKYSKNPVIAGYYGCDERNDELDRIVEIRLQIEGLNPRQIAIWLASTQGRHMMDDYTPKDYGWTDPWMRNALKYVQAIEAEVPLRHFNLGNSDSFPLRLRKEELDVLRRALEDHPEWFRPEPWKMWVRHVLATIVGASTN